MLIATSGVLLDLGLPLASITDGEDDLPLPSFSGVATTTNDEHYFMSLLAQISLSRLTARVRSFQATFQIQQSWTNVEEEMPKGYASLPEGGDNHHYSLSTWISEVDRQLNEWRAHLPDPLQWNDNHAAAKANANEGDPALDPPLDPGGTGESPFEEAHNWDILIAVLRSKYLHAKYLIGLPVIYKALHFPARITQKDLGDCMVFIKVCRFQHHHEDCWVRYRLTCVAGLYVLAHQHVSAKRPKELDLQYPWVASLVCNFRLIFYCKGDK